MGRITINPKKIIKLKDGSGWQDLIEFSKRAVVDAGLLSTVVVDLKDVSDTFAAPLDDSHTYIDTPVGKIDLNILNATASTASFILYASDLINNWKGKDLAPPVLDVVVGSVAYSASFANFFEKYKNWYENKNINNANDLVRAFGDYAIGVGSLSIGIGGAFDKIDAKNFKFLNKGGALAAEAFGVACVWYGVTLKEINEQYQDIDLAADARDVLHFLWDDVKNIVRDFHEKTQDVDINNSTDIYFPDFVLPVESGRVPLASMQDTQFGQLQSRLENVIAAGFDRLLDQFVSEAAASELPSSSGMLRRPIPDTDQTRGTDDTFPISSDSTIITDQTNGKASKDNSGVIHRLFVESSGFEEILYRGGEQVDHGDKGMVVSIPSGSAFGRLEETIERFEPGIAVARYPARQDGFAMLLHCFQSSANGLEQIDIRNKLQGNIDETAQSPPCTSHRSRPAHPAEHLLDTPCLGGLQIHAHQFRQGFDLLLR